MGLTARDKGGGATYPPVEEGLHGAIAYAVYDLGHQYNEHFGSTAHKCRIFWELPDERIQIERDGEKKDLPRAISKEYTVSLNEKANLRKDLESWRGKSFTEEELAGFDITKLLGVNCTLQILHKKKGEKRYPNVVAVVPLMKGTSKRKPENPTRYFSFEEHQDQIPEGTPEWIIDMIKASNEWEDLHQGKNTEEIPYSDTPPPDDDEGIPF